jgi:hypothetical protein
MVLFPHPEENLVMEEKNFPEPNHRRFGQNLKIGAPTTHGSIVCIGDQCFIKITRASGAYIPETGETWGD